jgi:tetratricopeptide (TPR) repeat protein
MKTGWLLATVLALVLASASAPGWAQQGDKVALLIGNSNYPDADAPLKQPVADARALADELKRNGFEVDIAENLTKEQTQRAIDRFYRKIKSGSSAVFFFSGFGIQTGRQTYLIPVNAQIWTEAEVRRDGLGIDTVLAEMNARGASVKLAILDASRRNPFERRFRGVSTGLAPVTAPRGTLVISAAAPGTVVSDGDGDSSMFVRELLKEMRSPNLTVEEFFTRTRIGVSRVSKGEQVPWIASSLTDEFYLGRVSPAVASDSRPPASDRDRDRDRDRDSNRDRDESDMRRAFDFAEHLGTKKAWEDFLDKHKNGPLPDRARERLARLEASRPEPRPEPRPKPDSRPQAKPDPKPEPRPKQESRPQAKADPKPEPRVEPHVEPRVEPREEPKTTEPLVQELDRQIADNPNDPDNYFKRGIAHAQKGRYSQAVKDFDQTIRLNPKDAEAFNNRCWARAVLGELQPALKDCNESLRLKPNFIDALDSRGLVNLKIGLPSSAIADYNAALRINPKHASALFGRGKAKLRNGDSAGGNADIAAAKAINRDIAQEFEDYGIK